MATSLKELVKNNKLYKKLENEDLLNFNDLNKIDFDEYINCLRCLKFELTTCQKHKNLNYIIKLLEYNKNDCFSLLE